MRTIGAAALLMLTACEAEEAEGPGPGQAETIDAARLLTSEEVGAALGGPVGPAQRQLEKARLTQAAWTSEDGRRSLSLMARSGVGEAGWGGDEVRKMIREGGGAPEDVPGLGRDAFWSEGMLHVLDERGNAFILTISPAEGAKPKAVALMRQALGRIDAR